MEALPSTSQDRDTFLSPKKRPRVALSATEKLWEEVKQEPTFDHEETTGDTLFVTPFAEVKEEEKQLESDVDDNDKEEERQLESDVDDNDTEEERQLESDVDDNDTEEERQLESDVDDNDTTGIIHRGYETEDDDYEPPPKLKARSSPAPQKIVSVKRKPIRASTLKKQEQKRLREDFTHIVSYRRKKEDQHDFDIANIAKLHGLEGHFTIIQLSWERQIADLQQRKRTSNYRDSPFKCDLCFTGYLQEETFQNHMARHDVTFGGYECEVCTVSVNHQASYTAHMMRHVLRFLCHQCDFVAEDLDLAKKHKAWHDSSTLKCQHCDQQSASVHAHVIHVQETHGVPAERLCALCGYSFGSRAGLRAHCERVHPQPDAEPAAIERESARTQTSASSSVSCAECEMTFSTAAAKRRHLLTDDAHAPQPDRDTCVQCVECGLLHPMCTGEERAAWRAHRRLHALGAAARVLREARAHAGPKRYLRAVNTDDGDEAYPAQCEHCDEILKNRAGHYRHYKSVHKHLEFPLTGDNFVCEHCGKCFPTNALLAYHVRSHTDQPRLQCTHCAKPFFSKEKLTAHINTHSGNRLPCHICGKTFKTKLGLEQHEANHSLAGAHPCLQCGKTFPRAAGLALHVKKSHRIIAPPAAGNVENI